MLFIVSTETHKRAKTGSTWSIYDIIASDFEARGLLGIVGSLNKG